MKRVSFTLAPDVDAALAKRAKAEGVSKAALVRRFLRERLSSVRPLEVEPPSH